MSTTSTVSTTSAAAAAAALVPAELPLSAVPATELPPGDAPTVVAAVVGRVGAELAVVLGPQVAAALAEGVEGAAIDPADALRPALQAAAGTLGDGVLEPARLTTAALVLGPESEVVALQGGGRTLAWFVLRPRAGVAPAPTRPDLPTQRGVALRALYDVELTLTAEIGRMRLPLREVLDLTPGTVLELDRAAGSPADIVVNGRLVARGEIVVVDEDFAVRVTEIVSAPDAH